MTISVIASRRIRMALGHLAISFLVGIGASLIIFNIWYPAPFASISGVGRLLTIVVAVDIILGPALTAVVASPEKPPRIFARDLAVIVALQLTAFAYGLATTAQARPVALVFEVDLFRLVSAADIEPGAEAKAPFSLRKLSWTGPVLMAAAMPPEGEERLKSIELGLAGIHLAMQPTYWRPYSTQAERVWKAARPVSLLTSRHPVLLADMNRLAQASGLESDALRFLPLTSRHADWVVLLASPEARVVGYLPVSGFF